MHINIILYIIMFLPLKYLYKYPSTKRQHIRSKGRNVCTKCILKDKTSKLGQFEQIIPSKLGISYLKYIV